MPSLEEVPENGMSIFSPNSHWVKDRNKCSCCPYGYHIDLEFVEFSMSLLSRPGDVTRVQALKDKWRSERQSMDKLLGANGLASEQESKRSSHVETDIWNRKTSQSNGIFLNLAEKVHNELKLISAEEPFDNGLEAAEAEFDLALQRAQHFKRGLSYEVNDLQKFHTFPRIKSPFGRKVLNDTPIIPKREPSRRSSIKELYFMNEGNKDLAGSNEYRKNVDDENGEAICTRKEFQELNERVRSLTRENWKLKCEKLATEDSSDKERFVRKSIKALEAKEHDELRQITAEHKPKTRDTFVQAIPRTRDAAVSQQILTRSIGIGGIGVSEYTYTDRARREEPSSPTGSLSGTLRRRVRTFDVGTQINECDFEPNGDIIPLLQIVERTDATVQTSFENLYENINRKEASSLAKVTTFDVGTMFKPDVQNALCGSELFTKAVKIQTEMEPETPLTPEETPDIRPFPVHLTPESVIITPAEEIEVTSTTSEIETTETNQVPKASPKVKPKTKIPKSAIDVEKYPAPFEPAPKAISRIPRLSPGPKSPSKSEFEWPRAESLERDETPSPVQRPVLQRSDTYTKESFDDSDRERSPLPRLQKAVPSKEMQGALKVLNDALLRGRTTHNVTSAIGIILHEWFRISGTKMANPHDVEDYLDNFENYSPQILRYIVNMPDGNGNTAMHYAVSHGNFDVVSILLDSRVCDPNKANKAGYTSVMLVALAKVVSDTHRHVVRRLFSMGDVNTKAAQHGQTALMLAASHGRLDTVKLLLEAGAEINLQDEDGSTALMCASEHGHAEIVRYLLSIPECNPNITDNDGSTALSVAMEAGHKDVGVMLYAHMNFAESPTDSSDRRIGSEVTSSPTSSKASSPIAAKRS